MNAARVSLLVGAGDDQQKAAPLGLFVLLLLGVACYFLFKSMSRHLKRVREDFPAGPTPAGATKPTGPTKPTRPTRPKKSPRSAQPAAPVPAPQSSAQPGGAGVDSVIAATPGVDDLGRRDRKSQ